MIACPAQAGEPYMIENYIHYVFVFEFNHVGFISLPPHFLQMTFCSNRDSINLILHEDSSGNDLKKLIRFISCIFS
jgi:hypothetical protein